MHDRFPVCYEHSRAYQKLRERGPETIPWAMIAAHSERVIANHGAELAAIAGRGGLTPCELMAALDDRPVPETPPNPFMAVRLLGERVDQWERPLARDVDRQVGPDVEAGVLLVPVVLRGPETDETLRRVFGRTYWIDGVGRARIKGYQVAAGQRVTEGARLVVSVVLEVA